MESEDRSLLDQAMDKMARLGINHPLVREARQVRLEMGDLVLGVRHELEQVVRYAKYKCLSKRNL